jgi:hypothetical protein
MLSNFAPHEHWNIFFSCPLNQYILISVGHMPCAYIAAVKLKNESEYSVLGLVGAI